MGNDGRRGTGRGRIGTIGCVLILGACVQETQLSRPRRYKAYEETSAVNMGQELSLLRGAPSAAGPRAVNEGFAWSPPQDPTAGIEPLEFSHLPPDSYTAEVVDAGTRTVESPFHRFEWNLVRNPDGSLTKLYYFRAGKPGAQVYVEMLQRFVPGFAALQSGQDYWIQQNFVKDARKKNEDTWRQGSAFGLPFGVGDAADLLMVTADEELLAQVDSFLVSMLAEVPQVEVEVTIVEIAMDDQFDIGITTNVTRGTPDDPESGLIDSVVFNLAKGLAEGTFGSFSAIHDELVINGLLEFLQTTTDSNVLSSPKLAVLNGHRAIIDTGSDTPFFTPSFGANDVKQVQTQFKKTGIGVVVVPFILNADTVQLDLSIEVSAVTGFVTAGIGSSAEVVNPLIAKRNAFTVVNVPSGKTVMIGGLVTTDDVETIEKVPFLGDIPLLGYLFKSKSSSTRRTQVLFMVKPTIIRDRFRAGVLYDPMAERGE